MNWETLYCPNVHCHYYGLPFGQGRLVKNGTYGGQPQARCQACGSSVTLRYGTAYYGLDTEPSLFEIAVRALAEGNSLRATGRIVQIDKDTACAWLNRAAQWRSLDGLPPISLGNRPVNASESGYPKVATHLRRDNSTLGALASPPA